MITALPPAPSRGDDSDVFVARADAHIAALPRLVNEINAISKIFNLSTQLATLGYFPPVPYAAGISLTVATQTVQYGANAYAAILTALPFTTSGNFEVDKFRLIQGVTAVDLAAPGGATATGYQAPGAGTILERVADRLDEFPSVNSFGAVGDGVTNNAHAFQKMEEHASPAFYVPFGQTFQSGLNSLVKRYFGPGNVLLVNGTGASGTSSAELLTKFGGLDVNTGRGYGVTQELFLTDSIPFGVNVPREKSPIYLLQQMLNAKLAFGQGDYLSGANMERIGTTGVVTIGSKGPLRRSRIMAVGSTMFFTADYINYLSFHFERTPTAGTINIKRAGVLISSNNCAGAAESDVFSPSSWPNITASGKGVVYTLECVGAAVEITGIFAIHLPDSSRQNPVMIQYQGLSGASMADYLDIDANGVIAPVSTAINSLKKQIFYANFFCRWHLILGTNGIYNTGKQVPVQTYMEHLIALITRINPRQNRIVLYVPLRAGNRSYIPAYAPFETYRTSIYQVARLFGLEVVDLSELDMITNGSLQEDDLHLNEYGCAAWAAFVYKKLFSHIVAEPRQTSDFVFAGVVAHAPGYALPQATMGIGAAVVVQGGLAVQATLGSLPKGSNLINMPPSFAPINPRIFLVGTINPAGSCGMAWLRVDGQGSIQIVDYTDPTATLLFLDGVTYSCT